MVIIWYFKSYFTSNAHQKFVRQVPQKAIFAKKFSVFFVVNGTTHDDDFYIFEKLRSFCAH